MEWVGKLQNPFSLSVSRPRFTDNATVSQSIRAATTPGSAMLLQPSIHILTSKPLFTNIVDFIPGVPYFVLTFKKQFDKELIACPPAKRQRTEASSSDVPTPTLWPDAVGYGDQRVLRALHALAKVDAYAQSPQLQFNDIVGYAAIWAEDIEFLDWIYATFTEQHERNVTAQQCQEIATTSPFEVVQWIHEHQFPFTPGAMDVAALCGRFDVVQFLHAQGTGGCTKSAMDFAAASGHLHIVRFLHEHRTEGCTVVAMSLAVAAGHLDVLRFLHENRTEGCSPDTAAFGAKQGHLHCIKYLYEHRVGGFAEGNALGVAVVEGHLEIVKFLHGISWEYCREESLYEASKRGHDDVVEYLCLNRPMENPDRLLVRARDGGLDELVASLERGKLSSNTTKTYSFGA